MSYIWLKEIVKIEDTIVTFIDWVTEQYTPTQLKYCVTDEPKDPSQFREVLLDNVLPEINELVKDCKDTLETATKVMEALERHNLTNAELQAVLPRIMNLRIKEYNELLKEKVWDEVERFKSDAEKIKEIEKIIWDSYAKMIYIATGKLLGTYEENITPEDCVDNIRFSHLIKAVTLPL